MAEGKVALNIGTARVVGRLYAFMAESLRSANFMMKRINVLLRLLFTVFFVLLVCTQDCIAVKNTPMSEYKKQSIAGFTVLIHPDVLAHSDDAKQLLIELKSQLEHINEVVPQPQLSSLKNVKIWVEWLAKDKG